MSYQVNFVCRSSKANRQGLSPIEMTISVNCKRVFLSLPYKCVSSEFHKAMSSRRNNEIKIFCNNYFSKAQSAIVELSKDNVVITAQVVKDKITGEYDKVYTIEDLFKDFLSYQSNRVEADEIPLDRWVKYTRIRDLFFETIDKNSAVNSLTNADILKYRTECNKRYKKTTMSGKMTMLKSVIKFAIDNRRIKDNPFKGIRIDKAMEEISTINDVEYNNILNKVFGIERLDKVKDLFILSCNCGLSFSDMMSLVPSDFERVGERLMINKSRIKTDVKYHSVVLEDGIKILEKYNYDISSLKISNVKTNLYLKEIADVCKVFSCVLTFHKARHYYTTKLLRMGVDIEIVRQCVGHNNVKMTQHYLHLINDDVANAVSKCLGK